MTNLNRKNMTNSREIKMSEDDMKKHFAEKYNLKPKTVTIRTTGGHSTGDRFNVGKKMPITFIIKGEEKDNSEEIC